MGVDDNSPFFLEGRNSLPLESSIYSQLWPRAQEGMAGQAVQREVASDLGRPRWKGRVGLVREEGQGEGPFPQDWTCPALPCANTPSTC